MSTGATLAERDSLYSWNTDTIPRLSTLLYLYIVGTLIGVYAIMSYIQKSSENLHLLYTGL